MANIKSQKAQELIDNCSHKDRIGNLLIVKENAEKSVEIAEQEMIERAIEAFKKNCQYPTDTKECECRLCIRYINGKCALLNGFINQLNN